LCSAIANSKGTFGEDNAIEHRLYERLREATERFGNSPPACLYGFAIAIWQSIAHWRTPTL
jgi:hypothetical protein